MFDKKSLQEQFNKVISFSQGIDNPQTDELFKRWLDAKRDMIEAMDGNLIYTMPEKITFELSHREKMNRVNDFISAVEMTWQNDCLAGFLEQNKEGFFSNRVVDDMVSPSGDKIQKGMKLVKAFKFFENDKITLEQLQNHASMLIQEDKIEGHLCFSVHPLDFLSTSENTYNWRSCHALDGEYRCGNLSYMVDKSTIVVYLKSDKEEILPNFPSDVLWNSKKWRMLLFLSDRWNAMYAGRQYPFFSENALSIVTKGVKEALKLEGYWSNWYNKEITTMEFEGDEDGNDQIHFGRTYIPIGKRIYEKRKLITDGLNSMHFNDLLRSSCYTPYYSWAKGWWIGDEIHFSIGEEIPCLRCGAHPVSQTDDMLCEDCELDFGTSEDEAYTTCDCCGRRILSADGVYIESIGETFCRDCADSECGTCECCGDLVYKDYLVYDKKHHEYRCKDCIDDGDEISNSNSEFIRDQIAHMLGL